MSNTNTLSHETTETERSTIVFPKGLWKRARRLSIELEPAVSANQMVVDGLEKILPKFEAQLDKQQRESQKNPKE